ncbi:asparagine synthase (glutamine-hydrolyzing) [Opitutaceae bacterium EW11]|nr:asparagine synthase (glutamine-hydrolyzing) [Opitutaceae bacterium EW11]
MCGIAGFVHAGRSTEARREAVGRMCSAMAHRGPDDDGVGNWGPATLGMRRLAIFDPAHGRQPMSTADGRFHLVFNGAIYNFRELRRSLASLGHAFATECDTEVLLAAYAQWGDRCLHELRGMFAFAVWDAREETLFLARDPFGIKPLYHAATEGGLVFASEIRSLLASGAVTSRVDPLAVSDSLAYLAPSAPRTFYRDVRSLRPGECAVWRNGRMTVRTYWSFRDASALRIEASATRGEFVSELRRRLDDTIRAHCLADVPVGAFLSGGLDSIAIVGLMARQHRAELKTFSIGFEETEYSEVSQAAAAARHFGTAHRHSILTGKDVAADLDMILDALDQPTGDAVNTYYASRLAKAGGVTVALSGLGGDELFGGYPWFRATPRLARLMPLWRALPAGFRSAVLRRLRRGDSRAEKLADLLEHGRNLQELAALQRRSLAEPARQALLREPTSFAWHAELEHLAVELDGQDPFSVISAWEFRTYMADVLLRDSDVMSMRHSLELRVPFVDRPLLEWFWHQPQRFKIHGTKPKAALAEAVADILPAGAAQRPKQGFTLPFALWMRGPLRPFLDETFAEASVARSGFFNTEAVQARWRGFLANDDPREWSRVWSLAVLIAFLNRRRLSA